MMTQTTTSTASTALSNAPIDFRDEARKALNAIETSAKGIEVAQQAIAAAILGMAAVGAVKGLDLVTLKQHHAKAGDNSEFLQAVVVGVLGKRPEWKDQNDGTVAVVDRIAKEQRRRAADEQRVKRATLLASVLANISCGHSDFKPGKGFHVPSSHLLSANDDALSTALKGNKPVHLDGTTYRVLSQNSEGKELDKKIQASVAQLIAVYDMVTKGKRKVTKRDTAAKSERTVTVAFTDPGNGQTVMELFRQSLSRDVILPMTSDGMDGQMIDDTAYAALLAYKAKLDEMKLAIDRVVTKQTALRGKTTGKDAAKKVA